MAIAVTGPVAALVFTLSAVAACTSTDPDAAPDPRPNSKTSPGQTAPTPGAPSSGGPTPTAPDTGAPTSRDPADLPPNPPDDPAGRTEPQALAVNLHRTPVRIGERLARRLVEGEVRSWRELGQPGGRLDLRQGPGALDAVEADPDVLAVVPASALRPTVQAALVAGLDPLVSPARYPVTTLSDSQPPTVTTMTVVGDIMLARRVGAATPDDPGATLDPLARRLARADLTVGNLESTLSRAGAPRQGDDSFGADPAVLDDLVDAGFDLVSLANNHTGDYGEQALEQTLRRVDRSGLERVGAGVDGGEAWAPVVLRRDGVRFGFLAFNAIGETPRAGPTSPGAAEIRMQPRTGPLDADDLRRMTSGVARLSRRVDVVVVLPHWGEQYTHSPVPDQRIVGRALVDAGADLVVGGHPHWVQGVQVHRDRLVAHSLGNFIFDMDFSIPTQEGAMLELVFWDDELMAARFAPYVIGADFAPRVVSGSRAESILDDIWGTSDPPFGR